MSESVPSSATGFANRRTRADSTASFTYFEENQDAVGWDEDGAVTDDSDDNVGVIPHADSDDDLEAGIISKNRRQSSGFSRTSAEDPLLHRHDSAKTNASGYGQIGRISQKIYIVTEDLTVVVAGFTSSYLGLVAYAVFCIVTLGLGYLLLRWLPRWRVRLVGSPKPLRECSWVVMEVRCCLVCRESHTVLMHFRINGANLLYITYQLRNMGTRSPQYSDPRRKQVFRNTMRMKIRSWSCSVS